MKEKKNEANRLREAVTYLKSIGLIKYQKDLAPLLDYNHQVVSKMIAHSPTKEFLNDFCDKFKDIFNEKYILEGEGTLLRDKTEEKGFSSNQSNKDEIINRLLEQLSGKDKQIERKDEQIRFLQDQLSVKDKEILKLHSIIEGLTNKKENIANVG